MSWDKETTQMFHVWNAMRKRCSNPSDPAYKNYGGRGITVCERWSTFSAFYEDMSPRPAGGLLDRIDNDGNYSPDNCRWANRTQQNSNRRNCIFVTVNGLRVTLKEACRMVGLKYRPVHKRIVHRGWDIDRALSTPIGKGNTHANA